MAYIAPEDVMSPKTKIGSVEVLYNEGSGSWSLARLEYDGEERLGIRWNGSEGEKGIGTPQARGKPTWFVLPEKLAEVIRDEIEKFGNSKHAELLRGYSEMAADREREAEAEAWCEGLIGDANQAG